MLVSEIGYINSVSKSMYGIDVNKNQNNKYNLGEGFGHFNEPYSNYKNNSNLFTNWASSLQSMFTPKSDESKKYLSLIG